MKRNSSGRILSHTRKAAMALVALLLLVAGFWTSWGTAQHILLSKGREHGTLTVARCDDKVCTGSYVPKDQLHQRRDRIMTGQATEEEATLYNAWLDTRIAVQEVQYRMMRRPGEWVWS